MAKSLYRVIDCVLAAPPKLGPAFLNKVDLTYAYMRISGSAFKDIPSVAFLAPKSIHRKKTNRSVFHLSISMGYVESSAFF